MCDRYHGASSLFRVDLLTHCSPMLFLTSTPDSKTRGFLSRYFAEFRERILTAARICMIAIY
jgi:hypothetical protein